MKPTSISACIVTISLAFASMSPTRAGDIDGAWASDADACGKIFMKTRDSLVFAQDADLHGSGFIITGNRIRGKLANCAIKLRKNEGDTVHLAAACSTDVAVETVPFTLRIVGDDTIVRLFPGIPELETSYHRCRM